MSKINRGFQRLEDAQQSDDARPGSRRGWVRDYNKIKPGDFVRVGLICVFERGGHIGQYSKPVWVLVGKKIEKFENGELAFQGLIADQTAREEKMRAGTLLEFEPKHIWQHFPLALVGKFQPAAGRTSKRKTKAA